MTIEREFLDQVRSTEAAILNFDHYRQVAKRDDLISGIRRVVDCVEREERRLGDRPPSAYFLSKAVERIGDLIKGFDGQSEQQRERGE